MKPPAIFRDYVFFWLEQMLLTSLWCRTVDDGEGEGLYANLARAAALSIGLPQSVWSDLVAKTFLTFLVCLEDK